MKHQRSRTGFKALMVLLCIVLATYAGLFLAYRQLLQESSSYAQQLDAGNHIMVVVNKAP